MGGVEVGWESTKEVRRTNRATVLAPRLEVRTYEVVRKCACAWLCAGDVDLFCVLRRRKGWTISLLAAALSKRNGLRRWWRDETRGIPHALSFVFSFSLTDGYK